MPLYAPRRSLSHRIAVGLQSVETIPVVKKFVDVSQDSFLVCGNARAPVHCDAIAQKTPGQRRALEDAISAVTRGGSSSACACGSLRCIHAAITHGPAAGWRRCLLGNSP